MRTFAALGGCFVSKASIAQLGGISDSRWRESRPEAPTAGPRHRTRRSRVHSTSACTHPLARLVRRMVLTVCLGRHPPRARRAPSERCHRSPCRKEVAPSAGSARSSPSRGVRAPARCRCRSRPHLAVLASVPSSRCPTTRAQATARSASAGALSLPAITRKTDKGLPQYHDAEESDVYVLSGAEDLVPVLEPGRAGAEDDVSAPTASLIHRYRPRVEGLFARIERWTDVATGDVHWRSITATTSPRSTGMTTASRIFDPADPAPAHRPAHLHAGSSARRYDDKGNAIVYEYAAENDVGSDQDARQRAESHAHRPNRYLKRIKYGNRVLATRSSRTLSPVDAGCSRWCSTTTRATRGASPRPERPASEQHQLVRDSAERTAPGPSPDPFSSHRAGFEVRTYRRCQRVLMFHHFPDCDRRAGLRRAGSRPSSSTTRICRTRRLRRSTTSWPTRGARVRARSCAVDDPVRLSSAMTRGASIVATASTCTTYLQASRLPPLEFEYSKATIQDDVDRARRRRAWRTCREASTGPRTSGSISTARAFRDPTEQAGAWFYKPNLGDSDASEPRIDARRQAALSHDGRWRHASGPRRRRPARPRRARRADARVLRATPRTRGGSRSARSAAAELRLARSRTCGSSTSTATATPTS